MTMSALSMTTSAWRRTLVAGVAAVSLAAALPAAAGPMPAGAASGLQTQVVPAVADGGFDGAAIMKVRNGRNATAAAVVGGIAALGLGAAAIASQNRSYGGGYYAQPQGYYAAPQQQYYAPSASYYEAPPAYAYEEPAPVYVEPAPVYAPAYGYGYGPGYGYGGYGHWHHRRNQPLVNDFRVDQR
jgi:hypothetical protein